MPPSSNTKPLRRRRLWRRLAAVAGVVALAAATLPWWLPAVAVRVAGRYGVTVGAWHAHGWGGAEYRDVVYESAGAVVRVDSVRAPLLLVFPRGAEATRLEIGGVDVLVAGSSGVSARPPAGLAATLRQVQSVWSTARTWLPATRVQRVVIAAGGERVEIEPASWDGSRLEAAVHFPGRGIEGVASLAASPTGGFLAGVQLPGRAASVELQLDAGEDGGAVVGGTATWRDNTADLHAAFGPEGFVPAVATVRSEAWVLPAEVLGLDGYAPVAGSLDVRWSRDAYTLAVVAKAEPLPGSDWPKLAVDVRASGDREHLRLEAVDVDLPQWRAALSRPLDYTFSGGMTGGPVDFSVEGELAAIPALEARGRIAGTAHVRAAADGSAEVAFSLRGDSLGWRELEGAKLALTGHWRRPEIAIESVVVEAGPDARVEAAVAIDTGARTMRATNVRAVIPAALLRAISAELPPCERIELDGSLEGPWARPDHRGTLAFSGLEWTPGRRIGGTVTWSGQGPSVAAEGEVALAGGGRLPFAVRGSREADGSIDGTLERLEWVDVEGEWWRLAAPVRASYAAAAREWQVERWLIAGEGIEIGGEARVRWPVIGDVSLVVNGLEGRRFGGVLPAAIRGGRIDRVDLRAKWDHGPAAIDGVVRAVYAPVPEASYAVEGEFVTRESGLGLGSVRVMDASGVVLRGVGQVPLVVDGTDAGFRAELLRDGPISLELESEPNPVFWKSIGELTGWAIEEPKLACRLGGSLAAPRGEVQFSADTLRPPPTGLASGGALPALSGLQMKMVADDAGLAITESMVAIDHRWITLTGRADWEVWSRWRESGSLDWRRAAFALASDPLPIAIASRIFPTELAPAGEVSIRVEHEPGEGLSGRVWLHGAASRPIGPLGSIRDITSELEFSGYVVKLTHLDGQLGGQPMTITGEADLSEPGGTEFGLQVRSSRVPLVRRAGLIIRTELDLELKQGRTGPARVTGQVDFGPSLFSADLVELMPGGVDSPERRPPYFSVEEQPFADWELDVAAHGEAFLRLTTPFYKDVLSTDFRLAGTLGEPRVEGWVWGTGGVVVFPFGRIPVEQVLVTLARDNPYEPRLIVSGAGRVMGYDIRMEVSGPASEPRLLFTSDPPLTSQQVFLMLTTGAVPDEARTIGTSDRASRLAMFLGRNLAAGLGIGGGVGDERLSIRSGEDFTREGRETIQVQYDFDGRWSVIGEYDRFDAYNGGIKFRLINR